MAPAHAVGGVEGSYRRGDMLDKRRKLAADWAAYAGGKAVKGSSVVPIRRAAARG